MGSWRRVCVVAALALCAVSVRRFYSTDATSTQILAADGGDDGLSQLFPDYTKLANIAAKLPDGRGKVHAFKLLRSIELGYHRSIIYKNEAKAALKKHLDLAMAAAASLSAASRLKNEIPRLRQVAGSVHVSLETAQSAVAREQLAAGHLFPPQSLAQRHGSGQATVMSLSQVDLPPAVKRAMRFAHEAELQRVKPLLDTQAQWMKRWKMADAQLRAALAMRRKSYERATKDTKLMKLMQTRFTALHSKSINELRKAQALFKQSDKFVRKQINLAAFEAGTKLLRDSAKVPTQKDIIKDLTAQ